MMLKLLHIISLSLLILCVSCDGVVGPSGRDAKGLDIVPPTVVLTEPWSYSTVWDSIKVNVSTVDNVAIDQVYLYLDGSISNGNQALVRDTYPYSFTIRNIDRGFHFISARSIDVAGNYADSPIVPVIFGYSTDLQDTTVALSFNNGVPDTSWAIPNRARIVSFWSRFNPARDCSLATVSVMIGGIFSDTSEAKVRVGVMGGNNIPEESGRDRFVSLNGVDISGDLNPQTIQFDGVSLSDKDDFFVVVSLIDAEEGDTLRIGADDGEPYWRRSGMRDDLGWHNLADKFSIRYNFIINCSMYYSEIPDEEEP